MKEPLLVVEDLTVRFPADPATGIEAFAAVDRVGFTVGEGETLALVGESGCGKSLTALALLGLLPERAAVTGGRARFRGADLLRLAPAALRRVRGREIGMVFQEPATALNPVQRVGAQVAEVLRLHLRLDRRTAEARAVALLREVGMPDPEERARAWPHELSGGMRQRVGLAIALACEPALLIADEPTTALDVTVQAQVLDRIAQRRDELGTALLLITHDLGIVAEMADRVCVLYAGRVVEEAPVTELFERPRHPYTRGLLDALPERALARRERDPEAPLATLGGRVPRGDRLPSGCSFRTRCPLARAECEREEPPLAEAEGAGGARVACPFHETPTPSTPSTPSTMEGPR